MALDFAVVNGLFITTNRNFSSCCCDDGGIFWEALPCTSAQPYGAVCGVEDADSLCYTNGRQFIKSNLVCGGPFNLVCECQLLQIDEWPQIATSVQPDVCILANNSNYIRTTGTFGANSFFGTTFNNLTSLNYTFNFNYSDYDNLEEFIADINAFNPGPSTAFTFTNQKLANSAPVDGLFGLATYAFSSFSNISGVTPSIQLRLGTNLTSSIQFDDDPNTFAANMQSQINAIIGLGGIEVESDVNNLSTNSSNIFYITFGGNHCGISQPNTILKNRLSYGSAVTSGYLFRYGDYEANEGWSQETYYYQVPNRLTRCPYEDAGYTTPSGVIGFLPFDEEVQCCPQRGTTMGPNQNLGRQTYGSELEHVETTVVSNSNGDCYQVSPFFFIFGKEGRFEDDQQFPGRTFVLPACYPGNCGTGILPCNCVHELFIPSFHPHIPWGPFGSYFFGIEDTIHPATTAVNNGTIDGSCNIPYQNGRTGCSYRPSGAIKAVGTWINTNYLDIEFRFYAKRGFWVGNDCDNCADQDDLIFGTVTYPTGFQLISGNMGGSGTTSDGLIKLRYDCSGKTVLNFVTDINNILVDSASGACPVFKFCLGGINNAYNFPLNRINNTSSELFELWNFYGGDSGVLDSPEGYSDPLLDKYLLSGSSIYISPRVFTDRFTDDRVYPSLTNGNCQIAGKNPPPCKVQPSLPKLLEPIQFFTRNVRPFWNAMQGCVETIFSLAKNNSNFDPDIVSLYTSGYNRNIGVDFHGATGLAFTVNFNTNRAGSGFRVTDLINEINNFSTGWLSNSGNLYQPLLATSGSQGFDVWLDDSTWWDGLNPTGYGLGVQTDFNFGYLEPVHDLSATDITSNTARFATWVRRRCGWQTTPYSIVETPNDQSLRGCVPSGSEYQLEGTVNCAGDTVVEGNLLYTYGCNGYNCKTEFYIEAQRCSCNDLLVCQGQVGFQNIPHPFNRTNNENTLDFAQPTLYLCQGNIHPACNIPFLVKVPFQYLNPTPSLYCPTLDGYPASPYTVEYSVPPILDTWCAFNGGYEGWCQYIDPENVTVVSKESIPRTYPPSAFIIGRLPTPICTNNVNPFDLPTDSCPFPKYDAIGPAIPIVPIEYIFPLGHSYEGSPCVLVNQSDGQLYELPVYIRPMLKDALISDICGDNASQCGKVHIDCNTRCCGCGFTCKEGCANLGPGRGMSLDISYTIAQSSDGAPVTCCNLVADGMGFPGACHKAECITPNSIFPRCDGGSSSSSNSTTFSASYGVNLLAGLTLEGEQCVGVYIFNNCCFNAQGESSSSTIITPSCSDPYTSCCDGDGECAPDGTDCNVITSAVLDCSFPVQDITIPYEEGCHIYNEIILGYTERGETFCIPPLPPLFDVHSEDNRTSCKITALDDCGYGSVTWNSNGVRQIDVLVSGCGTPSFTISYSDSGQYTVDLDPGMECVFDNISSTPTYSDIINLVLAWECGYPGTDEDSGC